jgi:integrase
MSEETKSRHSLDGEIITIRRGLAIYKLHSSPYWFARIRDPQKKKNIVRSTKETSRIEARKAAEELAGSIFAANTPKTTPKEFQFEYFSDQLLKDAERETLDGARSKTYTRDIKTFLDNKEWGLLPWFGKKDVREIATKDFTLFIRKVMDERPDLSASVHNQLRTTFRRVMKQALFQGSIFSIPEVPKLNRSKQKTRTFFRFHPIVSKDRDDYQKLLKLSKEMSEGNIEVRGTKLTDELRDIIIFTTHSFVRPTNSELYALKHSDITVLDNPHRLQIFIRKGKTGSRIIDTMPASRTIYERIKERYPDQSKDDDYIFLPQYRNRDTAKRIIMRQFNYLLEKANLKIDPYTQQTHSMYSLRHTCLCMRLVLSEGEVNIYALANNSGTSVKMLQDFYLKTLPSTPQVARNIQSFGSRSKKNIEKKV